MKTYEHGEELDLDALLLKHFRPPAKEYRRTCETWNADLTDALIHGCDWLEHFIEHHNPTAAIAVEECCRRLEHLEAENARLRNAVGNAQRKEQVMQSEIDRLREEAQHLREEVGHLNGKLERNNIMKS